jgi:hypothetical protein
MGNNSSNESNRSEVDIVYSANYALYNSFNSFLPRERSITPPVSFNIITPQVEIKKHDNKIISLKPKVQSTKIQSTKISNNLLEKPTNLIYIKNKWNNMELKNENRMAWPRFVYNPTERKIIGVQNSNGNIDTLFPHQIKICENWCLEYTVEPPPYDENIIIANQTTKICDSILPEKPTNLIYKKNKWNNMELKNENRKPWPKFVYDHIERKIIGVQNLNGNIDTLSLYQIKVCENWCLEYVLEAPSYN